MQREIVGRQGVVARDLTGRSDVLVIGALATALIAAGSLGARLRSAKQRHIPVLGERSFTAALAGEKADEATLPLATALAPTALSLEDASVLAAFDLIGIEGANCRFADASVIRTAAELFSQGRLLADTVRILTRARNLAPLGRHKIVLTPSGEAALKWDNGLTTLEGQGYLPLDVQHAGVDELFEQAELHEAGGNGDEAAKLYERCANADRSDPIALFNLGNIRLGQGRNDEAASAYRRALARDQEFVEARYNLALALEASEKLSEASQELERVIGLEPTHSDAMFNLAQILMTAGNVAKAKGLYERYLALDPPADWAATARKAITYCTARLST